MTVREPGAGNEKQTKASIMLEFDDVLPEERIRLGPSQLTDVPIVRFNLLSQVRQAYDQDGIDELARSMLIPDGKGGYEINVIQPPTLARLTAAQAEEYISKINEVFSPTPPHALESLIPLGKEAGEHEGEYIVVIAGHRRYLAILKAAEVSGKELQSLDVSSNVIDGDDLTFSEAISIQYRENFHRRPDSWEDAFAINAIYEDGLATGKYKTFVDCAEHLAIDPDRVARAYRFQTLPETVRRMVKDGTLQFGRALMLSKVFVAMALNDCQDMLSEEQKDDFARKLQDNKLYLHEVMVHVLKHRRAALRDGFMAHTAKITTFPTNTKAALFAAQLVEANLGDVIDLKLILATQAERDRENDTTTRSVARDLAVQALRTIVATMRGDQVRIEDGRQTVLGHSARVNHLVGVMTKGVDAAQHVKGRSEEERLDLIGDGVAAATALAFEIEFVNEAERLDPNDRLATESPQDESIF